MRLSAPVRQTPLCEGRAANLFINLPPGLAEAVLEGSLNGVRH